MIDNPGLTEKDKPELSLYKSILVILAWVLVFTALLVIARYNYLLFHSSAEVFSIVIAAGMFILAWNTRAYLENNYLFFLGVAYLFIGAIDGLHILAYEGMGVFADYESNLPTQLWIAARYFESICLLIAPLFLGRRLNHNLVLLSLSSVAAVLISSIFFWDIFPDCYLPGSGLTSFKIISEYIICAFLLMAGLGIWFRRAEFEKEVYLLIILSILLTVGSELSFTAYMNVFGTANLLGHLLKITSFYLLYKAIIETGLKRPHNLLYRKLHNKQEKLQKINGKLTDEIFEREKIENERLKLIAELQEALSELKALRGILPMCSFCKKIRDDEGYWNQVEVYIAEHSEADFSHGICPVCVEKHYKDFL